MPVVVVSLRLSWKSLQVQRGAPHFSSPYILLEDVGLGFGAGVAGLGFVLHRGPGSGKSAVAHKGSPPLLNGGKLGGWSRGRVGALCAGWANFSFLVSKLRKALPTSIGVDLGLL